MARRIAEVESAAEQVSASPWTAPEALSALVETLEDLPPEASAESTCRLIESLCRLPALCPLLPNDLMFAGLRERVEASVRRVCKSAVPLALRRFPPFLLLLLRLMELRPSHIPALYRLLRWCIYHIDSSITLPKEKPQDAGVRQIGSFALRQHMKSVDPDLYSVGNNGCMMFDRRPPSHQSSSQPSNVSYLELWLAAVRNSSSPLDAGVALLTEWLLASQRGRLRVGIRVLAAELTVLVDACKECCASCRPAVHPSWMRLRPTSSSSAESLWRREVELSTRLPSSDLLLLGLLPEMRIATRSEDSLLLGMLGSTAVMLAVYGSSVSDEARRAFVVSAVDMAVSCGDEASWQAIATAVAYLWVWIAHLRNVESEQVICKLIKAWRFPIPSHVALYFCATTITVVGPLASRLLTGVQDISDAYAKDLQNQLLFFGPADYVNARWPSETLVDIRSATVQYLRKLHKVYKDLLGCTEQENMHERRSHRRTSIHFPPEVCEVIMTYLTPRRCGRLALINRSFYAAFHSPSLWKRFYSRAWPQHIFDDEISGYCHRKGWLNGISGPDEFHANGTLTKCQSCYPSRKLKKRPPCSGRDRTHDWFTLFKDAVNAGLAIRGKVAADGYVARICKVVGCQSAIRWRKQEKVNLESSNHTLIFLLLGSLS